MGIRDKIRSTPRKKKEKWTHWNRYSNNQKINDFDKQEEEDEDK